MVDARFTQLFGARDLNLVLGSLAKVVDCLHSKKPAQVTSGHWLLQLSNILEAGQLDLDAFYGISPDDYERWTKNFETVPWDCVITNVGRVGAVARVPVGVKAALGRNMTGVRPHDPDMDGAFIIAALLSPPVRREIELKTDSGTVMDALNVKNIPGLRLPQSSATERAAFQAFAAPLLEVADALRSEISLVISKCDELLPLLMSGRVRASEGVAA
jgi:type I restriction enzyme S subunit